MVEPRRMTNNVDIHIKFSDRKISLDDASKINLNFYTYDTEVGWDTTVHSPTINDGDEYLRYNIEINQHVSTSRKYEGQNPGSGTIEVWNPDWRGKAVINCDGYETYDSGIVDDFKIWSSNPLQVTLQKLPTKSYNVHFGNGEKLENCIIVD